MQFSDDAQNLFLSLTRFSPSDEGAAVVLTAAAALIVKEFGDVSDGDLDQMASEFRDLVFAIHRWRRHRGRSMVVGQRLHLVAGRDVDG